MDDNTDADEDMDEDMDEDCGRIVVRGQASGNQYRRGPMTMSQEHEHDWGKHVGFEVLGKGKGARIFEVWECTKRDGWRRCFVRQAKRAGWKEREEAWREEHDRLASNG